MQYDSKTLAELILQRDRLESKIESLSEYLSNLPLEPENDLSPSDPVLVLAKVKFGGSSTVYTYAFVKTPIGWVATGDSLNHNYNYGQSWDELMDTISNKRGRIVEMWQATELNQLV